MSRAALPVSGGTSDRNRGRTPGLLDRGHYQSCHDALRPHRDRVPYLSPKISHIVVDAYLSRTDMSADPLTLRERVVLQMIADGHTTREIAATLDITVKTAESYRTRVMEKLDIHCTAGLVRYAVRRGVTSA